MDVDPSPVPAGVEPGGAGEAGDTTQRPLSLVEVLRERGVTTHNNLNQFWPDVRDLLTREARWVMEEAQRELGVEPHPADVGLVLGLDLIAVERLLSLKTIASEHLQDAAKAWRKDARSGQKAQTWRETLRSNDVRVPAKQKNLSREFGDLFREQWRKLRHDLEREDLARRLGVNKDAVRMWERMEKPGEESGLGEPDVEGEIEAWRDAKPLVALLAAAAQLVSSTEPLSFEDIELDRTTRTITFRTPQKAFDFQLDRQGELIMALLMTRAGSVRPEDRVVTPDEILRLLRAARVDGSDQVSQLPWCGGCIGLWGGSGCGSPRGGWMAGWVTGCCLRASLSSLTARRCGRRSRRGGRQSTMRTRRVCSAASMSICRRVLTPATAHR